MLWEGDEYLTELQYVAEVMNHSFTTVADHIGDATVTATPMVKNGNITMQDIVKHYENHLSVVKIKDFVQSRPFEYIHTTVEKILKQQS